MLLFFASVALSHAILTQPRRSTIAPAARRSTCIRATLVDSEWRITLNIGREKGTWMPDYWAVSGARLALPLVVKFTDDPVQRVEERCGRFRLECTSGGGSFVGAAGEVRVECDGGAWSATPTGACGESTVRFYLDFPEGATRNDVSLPAGRVFFNTACWDGAELEAASAEATRLEQKLEALAVRAESSPMAGQNLLQSALGVREKVKLQDEARAMLEQCRYLKRSLPDASGVLDVQLEGGALSDTKLAAAGGLSIKRDDARNLWGALGDVFLILGRFTIAPVADR